MPIRIDLRCSNGAHSKKKRTVKDFIEKSVRIHGDVYDYSKVVYKNNREKVIIGCNKHGDFFQIPNSHLCGSGCPECGKNKNVKSRSRSSSQFVDKARSVHGDRYGYSQVVYTRAHCKIIIVCPVHGEFKVDPNNFLNGHGCRKCFHEKRKEQNFIEKFEKTHGGIYDYSKVKYLNNNTKVCIICKYHGEFWQLPRIHRKGHGCPVCNTSKGELLIGGWLGNHGIKYVRGHTFSDLRGYKNKPLRFDFYLPELDALIEFDGQQHFYPVRFNGMSEGLAVEKFKRAHECDLLKNKYTEEKGITLLRIGYRQIDCIDTVLESKIRLSNDPLGDVAKGLLIAAMND